MFWVRSHNLRWQIIVAWEKKWAVVLAKLDTKINGVWPELETVLDQIITDVVLRSLSILQANGQEFKPRLIHEDYSEGLRFYRSFILA